MLINKAIIRPRLEELFRGNPELNWLTIYNKEGANSFTLRQLLARVGDYYKFYESFSLKKGEAVVIILKESLDLFASFIAAIIYGALPAYFAYPSPKQSQQQFIFSINNLMKFNRIKLLISYKEAIDTLKEQFGHDQGDLTGFFEVGKVPQLRNIDFGSLPESAQESFLQFSSGTTGAKKGVLISSDALANQIGAYDKFLKLGPDSKIISWLPHYHDMGLVACILLPLLKGVPLVMMSPFEWVSNPRILLDAIKDYKGTHVWLPNFALGHLTKSISDAEASGLDLTSLKQVICCSEPVLADTVDSFVKKFSLSGLKESMLYNCYAMAENTFAMASTTEGPIPFIEIDRDYFLKEHKVRISKSGYKIASVGVPLSNIAIKIIDSNGVELKEAEIGQIIIKSDCMLSGYHNNPQESRNAFLNEWFKTGDLGFFYRNNYYVTGRQKDLIIVGGENIYPQDIESILNEEDYLIPGRNLALGISDERIGTERVVILAEVKDGQLSTDIDTISLRTRILNNLNISVSEIIFLPHMTLLKATAGKISRALNRDAYLSGAFDAHIKAFAHSQGKLAHIIHSVIPGRNKPHITPETMLLKSGIIDSFAFIDLMHTLEKEFSVRIPENFWKPEYFQTIVDISKTIQELKSGNFFDNAVLNDRVVKSRKESLLRLEKGEQRKPLKQPLLIYIINHLWPRHSILYRILLRLAGVRVGKNVRFSGRIKLKIQGKSGNIIIGDNAVIGDNVDLRNREQGRIFIGEKAYIDDNTRITAARDGEISIGTGTYIGNNVNITSGGIVKIGRFNLISSNVNINSSDHGLERSLFMQDQGYSHGIIEIGDDVLIGAGASVINNSTIYEGAVIGSNSLVRGEIPAFAVCAGVYARLIKYR